MKVKQPKSRRPAREPASASSAPRPATLSRQGAAPGPTTLRAKIVRIGNSQGVRLPKSVIQQANLGDEVELIVGDHEVVLKSTRQPRAGWDEQFKKAIAELGPDALERERDQWADWQDMPNEFDEKEWTW